MFFSRYDKMKGMKLQLSLPVKPYSLNQAFGNNPLNPDGTPYYAKFLDALGQPLKGHMGADLRAVHGQPVYAPCDGVAWYEVDSHGGDGIYIRTNQSFDYKGGQAWFNLVHWHLCAANDPISPIKIATDGSKVSVKKGQLLGYADNTGAPFESSGDHLHWGLCPTDAQNHALEPANGFNGCIDPMPYWEGTFAADILAYPIIAAALANAQTLITNITNAPISKSDELALLDSIKKVVMQLQTLL